MGKDRLYLGYETAFWIWRKAGSHAFSALVPSRAHSLAGGAPSIEKLDVFRSNHPDLFTDPLDVVVPYGGQRRVPGVAVHTKSAPLPDRSFYRLDDDVFVASPELCLMQLASKLPEPAAVKLAMEMCGYYAIDPFADTYDADPLSDDAGLCKRPPLTDPNKLIAYASRLYKPGSKAHGVKFLRWVAGGSASPRETALCMLLCMPPRFGGYGIAIPELNRRVELTQAERLMVGAHHFDCDLYWHDARVAVEYDSLKYHTAIEKQERDAIRRNMLQYKDIQVIVATRVQVNKARDFDKLACQVARAVGKRLRIPEKGHVAARAQLRKTVFNWDVMDTRKFGEALFD